MSTDTTSPTLSAGAVLSDGIRSRLWWRWPTAYATAAKPTTTAAPIPTTASTRLSTAPW